MNPKLFSGRFWLTIIAGAVFFGASINGYLAPVDVKEILMVVIVFYFSKARKEG